MGVPTITQTWTTSFNNRFVFLTTSVNKDVMANFVVSLKNFLKTTMGYTVKGSSNGSTGGMDGVDRITSASAWQTRQNSSTLAISWLVLTDGAGIDWCFSYNSSSDDIIRITHSPGGVYLAASTATFQPTAVDECFNVIPGASFLNTNGGNNSVDRVWHFWSSSDKKMWRAVLHKGGTLLTYIYGEKYSSALVSPASTILTTGATVGAVQGWNDLFFGTAGQNSGYNSNNILADARVHANGLDVNAKVTFGGEFSGGGMTTGNIADKPALQGGVGQLLQPWMMGGVTAGSDGKLGSMYDIWTTNGNTSPIAGQYFGARQLVIAWWHIVLPADGFTIMVTS